MTTREQRDWAWLEKAARRLHAEVDPGARIGAVGIVVVGPKPADEIVAYSLEVGDSEIRRRVVLDAEGIVGAVDTSSIDASVS